VSALPLNTIEIVVNVEIVRKIVPRNLKTNRDAYAGLIDEPLSMDHHGSRSSVRRSSSDWPGSAKSLS